MSRSRRTALAASKAAESESAAATTTRWTGTVRMAAAASVSALSSAPPVVEVPADNVKEPSSSRRSDAAGPAPEATAAERRARPRPEPLRSAASGRDRWPRSPRGSAASSAVIARARRPRRLAEAGEQLGRGPARPPQLPTAEIPRILAREARGLVDGTLDGERGAGIGSARSAGRRSMRAHGDRLDAHAARGIRRERVAGGRAQQLGGALVRRAEIEDEAQVEGDDPAVADADADVDALRRSAAAGGQLLVSAQREARRPSRAQRDGRADVLDQEAPSPAVPPAASGRTTLIPAAGARGGPRARGAPGKATPPRCARPGADPRRAR